MLLGMWDAPCSIISMVAMSDSFLIWSFCMAMLWVPAGTPFGNEKVYTPVLVSTPKTCFPLMRAEMFPPVNGVSISISKRSPA